MTSDKSNNSDHPPDKRPRMSVDVLDTGASASAEAVTRPVVGRDEPLRTGEIEVNIHVRVACPCGREVMVRSVQGSSTCGCGRRWSM